MIRKIEEVGLWLMFQGFLLMVYELTVVVKENRRRAFMPDVIGDTVSPTFKESGPADTKRTEETRAETRTEV